MLIILIIHVPNTSLFLHIFIPLQIDQETVREDD